MTKVKTYAVIGSGYGDEGKGLVVDALSSTSSRVVRFNGGCQAAHTVVFGNRRHVFHSIGSGVLRGAQTHLSRFFVVNPILVVRELREFTGLTPLITADLRCQVTTPLDMMINQALESSRGHRRHGSCGVGFGETIERSEQGHHLRLLDLVSENVDKKLAAVNEWAHQRCHQLGIDFNDLPYDPAVDKTFLHDCQWMMTRLKMMRDGEIANGVDRVIFEGAQGLGLDMMIGHWPHVTRSLTGLPNVVELASSVGISGLDAIYVTRSYATRHGAGPLALENKTVIDWPKDFTNSHNEWQGSFRYAPLCLSEKKRWIQSDITRAKSKNMTITPKLFMTWCDFIKGLPYVYSTDWSQYPSVVASRLELSLVGTSSGPSKEDINWR